MNKIGLHLGYWWGTEAADDLHRMLRLTHRAGLDIVEINPAWLLRLSDAACRELRAQAAHLGLSFTLNGGLESHNDIASPDPAVRGEGVRHCVGILRRAPLLGITVWSGVHYSAWLRTPRPEGDFLREKAQARALSAASLGEILRTAEEVGVDYCLEVVNRFEQFLFNTAAEALGFVEELGSPRAKLLLDTFHMNIEENSIFDALALAAGAGRLGHLHAGESNRRVPGVGGSHLDWERIGRVLRDHDYRGAVVMEPFVLTAAHNARRTRVWRDLCGDTALEALVADARKGGSFLRGILRGDAFPREGAEWY